MGHPFEHMLNEQIVLDTGTPILYIGTLLEYTNDVFVLADADMHDCREGHANKEVYMAEAHNEGITVNRRNVVVMRSAIISVSRVTDIVVD